MTNERMIEINQALTEIGDSIKPSETASLSDYVAKINARGYDFTEAEIKEFFGKIEALSGDTLDEDALENVAGGFSAVLTGIVLGVAIGIYIDGKRSGRW